MVNAAFCLRAVRRREPDGGALEARDHPRQRAKRRVIPAQTSRNPIVRGVRLSRCRGRR